MTTVLLLLFAAALSGAEFEMSCPATLRVEQKAVGSAPDGWEAVTGTDVRALVNVEFSDGHPKDRAVLRPDNDSRRTAKYEFHPVAGQGTWLACTYKETSAKIAKRLPDDATSCVVEYSGQAARPIARIRCLKP